MRSGSAALQLLCAALAIAGVPRSSAAAPAAPAGHGQHWQFACNHPQTGLATLILSPANGSYTVFIGATAGHRVALPSAPYRILHGGRWHNSSAGGKQGLTLLAATARTGTDPQGPFDAVDLHWSTQPSAATTAGASWVTTFRCYNGSGTVVFAQSFPDGLSDQPGGLRDFNVPSTAFPAFGASVPTDSLNVVTFSGQNAAETTQVGMWPAKGGYEGGPVAFFMPGDLEQGVCVISPLSQFMATLMGHIGSDSAFGLGGLVHSVPAGFTVDFVLSCSVPPAASAPAADLFAGLMTHAWMEWGDTLLREYSQQRTAPDASPWISQLGYSTTGVFHCESCLSSCLILSHPVVS